MSPKKIFTNIGISIAIGALTFLGFFLISRRSSNRRGISSDRDIADRIESGNNTIEEGLNRVEERVENHEESVDRLTDRASTIEAKLSTAIEILRRAKQKSKSNLAG